jgi:hypothetical protein
MPETVSVCHGVHGSAGALLAKVAGDGCRRARLPQRTSTASCAGCCRRSLATAASNESVSGHALLLTATILAQLCCISEVACANSRFVVGGCVRWNSCSSKRLGHRGSNALPARVHRASGLSCTCSAVTMSAIGLYAQLAACWPTSTSPDGSRPALLCTVAMLLCHKLVRLTARCLHLRVKCLSCNVHPMQRAGMRGPAYRSKSFKLQGHKLSPLSPGQSRDLTCLRPRPQQRH